MYTEFNGDGVKQNYIPNAEESKRFWDDIWSMNEQPRSRMAQRS